MQVNGNGNSVAIGIGRVRFRAIETATLTVQPDACDPVTGALVAGAGAITGLTVTPAAGQVASLGVSAADALDVEPDRSANGADVFRIS